MQHRFDGLDRVMAMLARRLETENVADPVEIDLGRLLVDADRAVALDV